MLCPCCSKKDYQECCSSFHFGTNPPNALSLMRSRYSAYALKIPQYIIKTTHPENSSFTSDTKKWMQDILDFSENAQFLRLEIEEFLDGDDLAYVTFIAYLKQGNREFPYKEKSLFKKVNGVWLYHSFV